jgi:hypothetical protein
MPDDKHERELTQLTQPKAIDPKTRKPYEPIEIPIPSEDDFEKLVRRAVKHRPAPESDTGGGSED